MAAQLFDVQAVCSGFVYALTVADAMIRAWQCPPCSGRGRRVFSRILDFQDRTTCAFVWRRCGRSGVRGFRYAQVSWPAICMLTAATPTFCACPATSAAAKCWARPCCTMDGQAVFKLAVGVLEKVAHATLAKAGLDERAIDWLIPHQANIRIMQSTARKLKLPMDKVDCHRA